MPDMDHADTASIQGFPNAGYREGARGTNPEGANEHKSPMDLRPESGEQAHAPSVSNPIYENMKALKPNMAFCEGEATQDVQAIRTTKIGGVVIEETGV